MITLLSDFGLDDAYVAQMKAMILSILPDARIADISHGVPKHDISVGSYLLETTAPFFPHGSIHIAVVDPGVGGTRLPIAIECDRGILVGPNNGLMTRAAERLGMQAAYQIKVSQFKRDGESSTFQGRDVFALTAARLAEGRAPREVGPELPTIVQLDLPRANIAKKQISCSVLYVDSFGNAVTNISVDEWEKFGLQYGRPFKVFARRGGEYHGIVAKSYYEIPSRKFGLLMGSQGYFEIALKEANAAAKLRVGVLDSVRIQIS